MDLALNFDWANANTSVFFVFFLLSKPLYCSSGCFVLVGGFLEGESSTLP